MLNIRKVFAITLMLMFCVGIFAANKNNTRIALKKKLGKNSPAEIINSDPVRIVGNYFGNNVDDFIKPVMFKDDNEGNRYILDYIYGKMVVFNKDLKTIKYVINGLKNPSFFAFIEDKIYITESNRNLIKIFDLKTGKKLSEFGKRGFNELEFSHPTGIYFYNNEIYIIDEQNFRIQILDKNNKFVSEILLPKFKYVFTPSYSINYSLVFKEKQIFVLDSYNKKVYLYEDRVKKEDSFDMSFAIFPSLIIDDGTSIYLFDNYEMKLYKFDYEFYLKEKFEIGEKDKKNKKLLYLDYAEVSSSEFRFLQDGILNSYNLKEKKKSILQNLVGIRKYDYILPVDIKTDNEGNLYILDLKQESIIKINTKNEVSKIIENIGYNPTGFCFDINGNIYIAVAGENCIKKYDQNGKMLITYGNYKEFPSNFDFHFEKIKAENTKINLEDRYNYLTEREKIYNMKVFVDNDGYIYVLNSKSMKVKVYDPFFEKKYEVGKSAGLITALKKETEKGAFGWDGAKMDNLKQLYVLNKEILVLDGFYRKIVSFEEGKYKKELNLSKYEEISDFSFEDESLFICSYKDFKIVKNNKNGEKIHEINLLEKGYMPVVYNKGYAIVKKFGNNLESYYLVTKIDTKFFETKPEERKK